MSHAKCICPDDAGAHPECSYHNGVGQGEPFDEAQAWADMAARRGDPELSPAADPLDELRAAYHDIPAGNPAADEILNRLSRLYAAIEAVLAHDPCKELGEAYVEMQGRFIRFSESHAAENILNRHCARPR